MSWAFAGALLGLVGSRSTDKTNKASTDAANAINVAEAQKSREFQVRQVKDARAWDAQQIALAVQRDRANTTQARTAARADALAAEKRGRNYAVADRDEYREYNDPAAVRARLEAAGINPATGVDNSGGFLVGAGAETPTSFAPSSVGAASSGIAPGAFAQVIAHQSQGYDIGSAVSQVFQSIEEGKYAQAELDLRTTQLDMENQRLAKLMETATMRPINPGIYGPGSARPSSMPAPTSAAPSVVGGPNGSSTAFPYLDEPSTYVDDTGIRRASPNNPAELEADLWNEARNGTIWDFTKQLISRNNDAGGREMRQEVQRLRTRREQPRNDASVTRSAPSGVPSRTGSREQRVRDAQTRDLNPQNWHLW